MYLIFNLWRKKAFLKQIIEFQMYKYLRLKKTLGNKNLLLYKDKDELIYTYINFI